ncbi:MAG: CopD family protein, partial [Thermoproteota archaeon]|nr:CopD family protein [Thermoproteota archaeon]
RFSLGVIILVSWLFVTITATTIQKSLPSAYGHAIPSTYSVEPNSILQRDSIPSELVISFSERPDPDISYIRVVNSEGERIDNDDFTISESNPRQAAVTLDTTKLQEDGVYTVSWRALSLDDGHIAQGSYVIGVGNVTPDSVGGSNQQQTQTQTVTYVTSTVDALLRWPLIVAQTAIVGGVIAYLVLPSGRRQRGLFNLSNPHNQFSSDLNLFAQKRFVIILIAGALAIAISGTALVFLQASNLGTDSSGDSFGDQYLLTVQSLIFGSPAGVVWSIRIATSAIIAVLALLYFVLAKRAEDVQRRTSSSSSVILLTILAAGAASIFSNSMLSHNSAATFLPSIAVFADWLHFMAVSAWVGGLFYFSAVVLISIKNNEKKAGDSAAYHLSLILPRFSLIATASLGVIGVTGLYMAWVHLPTLDSLFYTPYGNNLIFKLSAALPMVLLGAYHQVKLHKNIVLLASLGGPTKEEEEHSTQQHSDTISNTTNNSVSKFGKTIKIESLIGIGVLFAASLLTITSPPTQTQEQQGQQGELVAGMMHGMEMQNTGAATPGFSEQVTISGVDTTLEITPFHAGFNTYTVILYDAATDSPPQNINAVYLRFTNPEARIGPIVTTLNSTDDGSGRYSAIGGYLSQTGNWEIDLIVQRMGAYDLNHSFEANLEAISSHENMDMSTDMNMHMEHHEVSNATTHTNTNTIENELD